MQPRFAYVAPAFAVAAALWSASPAHAAPYQRFRIADKFAKTTPVPAKVLQTLQKDAVVSAAWASSRKAGDKSTWASWFSAMPIDLNKDGKQDLLIKSTRPELMLGTRGPFWVFLNGSSRPALRATTFAMRVLNSTKSGYRDLRSETVNGTTISTTLYQWNGKTYSVPTLMMR